MYVAGDCELDKYGACDVWVRLLADCLVSVKVNGFVNVYFEFRKNLLSRCYDEIADSFASASRRLGERENDELFDIIAHICADYSGNCAAAFA